MQISRYAFENSSFQQLLLSMLKHQQDLIAGNNVALAHKLGVSPQEVRVALRFMRQNLVAVTPGRQFNRVAPSDFIAISAKLVKEANQLKPILLESYQTIADPNLRRDLEERGQLLLRILTYLCAEQKPNILDSLAYLAPLTQRQLADELGLSYSLVSRLLSQKFIEVGKRRLRLRDLFQRGVGWSNWTQYRLQRMFKDYSDFSDIQVQRLLSQQGITISRRTVNYYRQKEARQKPKSVVKHSTAEL